MTFNLEDPVDVRRIWRRSASARRRRGLSDCGRVTQIGRADREQYLGGEDEAVADNTDLGVVAENLAQPAEKLGAVMGELLHLAGERGVQPLAESGDLHLLLRRLFSDASSAAANCAICSRNAAVC